MKGRQLGRLRFIWEDNIKMNVNDIVCGFMWLRVDSRVGPCQHTNKPSGSTKGGGFLDQLIDYQILLHGLR
jgi:hypothetical protein